MCNSELNISNLLDLFDKMILMAGNSECDWAIHDNVVEKCIHWSQKIGVNTYKHRKKEQEVSKRKKKLFYTFGFSW